MHISHPNDQRALRAYGTDVCLRAYQMHRQDGEGASTIGFYLGLKTRQADAAINAGRALRTALLREYLHAIEYDPSRVSCLPQYAYSTASNDCELRTRAAL